MSPFNTPTSFRYDTICFVDSAAQYKSGNGSLIDFSTVGSVVKHDGSGGAGDAHPSLLRLMMLVFEAVMEVVCISLPGYLIARCGMFNTEHQKFVANLNVMLFTPCLIFTKLASQLTLSKIAELAVIPVIFIFMTAVSYLGSLAVAKLFRLNKGARNFVIAMGVFGNSNSLPISLVMSLAYTISGLHWDVIPGDNDEEVAARGILYLLIFQQLGQLLRWSWGYHVLLAPEKEDDGEGVADGTQRFNDESDDDIERSPAPCRHSDTFVPSQLEDRLEGVFDSDSTERDSLLLKGERNHYRNYTTGTTDSAFESGPSGGLTPVTHSPTLVSTNSTNMSSQSLNKMNGAAPMPIDKLSTPLQGNGVSRNINRPSNQPTTPQFLKPKSRWPIRFIQAILCGFMRLIKGIYAFMNPPLWAMLAAVVVASVPQLQKLFFTKGTFINASVTRAVGQSGNVAVPLILVVLGANLANSTRKSGRNDPKNKHETKILVASLISRMFLPLVFIAPVLAFAAKYLTISILDDPIFVVVCFLLAGAPSALQLAQICQINNVYEDVITQVLFWSYVVVILPSTLILVISAIETVRWAT